MASATTDRRYLDSMIRNVLSEGHYPVPREVWENDYTYAESILCQLEGIARDAYIAAKLREEGHIV